MALPLIGAASVVALAGCGSDTQVALNSAPAFVSGTIQRTVLDGTSNDLLTAGLGKSGLQSAVSPVLTDPLNPSAVDLRRLAIYNNYRSLVDITTNGGFGVLFGPNIDANGVVGTGEGKIAGVEYIAYSDDGTGKQNVTMMVQIPSTFKADAPCIVTAASSGSRGVYGAIATAGEWGLKKGCAVAYTDKGTGNGAHDLVTNTVFDINGRPILSNAPGAQFLATTPAGTAANNRIAVKHAHSQQNPEKDWGKFTLQAVKFALFAMNEELAPKVGSASTVKFTADNTLVIASSVSNGAGASLQAAEVDTENLIDGVAVAEPQIQPDGSGGATVKFGTATVTNGGKSLMDYTAQAMLYQPCAALATAVAAAPGAVYVSAVAGANRCASLAAKGLLTATTTAAQADEALAKIHAAGWLLESDMLLASHFAFAVPAIAVTYVNTYAAANVADNLCGYGFAATGADFKPTPIAAAAFARLFGTGNGIPPSSGINIVNFNNPGGAILEGAGSASAGGKLDYNFDGAQCIAAKVNDATVAANIKAVQRSGKLQGKPTIIVHGRNDALVPVNHASRPYVAQSLTSQGTSAKLSYMEVTNAQHFDAFIGNAALPGYDTRFIPLHVYFNRAMDAMYDHLKNGKALPPSQVVRTTPRGGTPGAAPAIGSSNVPAFNAAPTAADAITFSGSTLTIPQ
ncbi:MAG: 3-hydroxybutyrate oligomer hydrolase family protein [Casimicrobium sp.]